MRSNAIRLTLSLLSTLAAACGGGVPGATVDPTLAAQTTGTEAALSAPDAEGRRKRPECPEEADFDGVGEGVERQLNIARQAVCKYRRIETALADGYANSGLPCIPGQGYHFIKGPLVGTTDIRHPSVLMYTGDGRLTGPEWIAPISTFPTPPAIFGHSMHAEDELGLWILHVWVWDLNSNGVFSDINPDVTCP